MSFEITTAFVQQYSDNIQLLSQQKGSRLRNAVAVKDGIRGKKYFHDQIGSTAAKKRTTRHGDTPLVSTPHARRMVTLYDYDWGDLIDDLDKVKLLTDPQSTYAQNAAYAMGRSMDDEIIAAATGTAYTGEDGTTATALPTAQKIAHGSAGLTIAKLRNAKKILDQGETDPEEPRHIAVSAEEVDDLLGTTQVTSSDYNSVKALVQGDVDTFMGFKFHRTERLSEASNVRTCFAWCESGILLGIGKDITNITVR